MNPAKKVPTLKEDDLIINESSSMMRYLCDSRELPEHWYPRDDLKARARVDERLDLHGFTLRRHVTYEALLRLFVGPSAGQPRPSKEEAKKITEKAHESLAWFDKQLEGKAFVYGDHICIADLQFYEEINSLKRVTCMKVEGNGLSNLDAWIARLEAFPEV